MKFLEEKFIPLASKIGSQRHLVAIKDAFVVNLSECSLGHSTIALCLFSDRRFLQIIDLECDRNSISYYFMDAICTNLQ